MKAGFKKATSFHTLEKKGCTTTVLDYSKKILAGTASQRPFSSGLL